LEDEQEIGCGDVERAVRLIHVAFDSKHIQADEL